MKIAHIIMAYKNPLQVERLVKRLNHPNFDIYIHLDKKVDIKKFEHLVCIERVNFIQNRVLCNWGGFSFVRAITSSVREVLSIEEYYGYINLMSAQDYPLKTNEYIYNFFVKNNCNSFISYDRFHDSDWWQHAVTRYELYHFTDINIKGRYFVQGILNQLMPKRKFPVDCKMYGSSVSSWWAITSDCARYVVDYLDHNPKLMKFMRFTWAADEFLYATIIMNSAFKERIINNNLRYIEWEEGKSNPRIFNLDDLKALKESENLFARKFDIEVDENVLDELDKHLVEENQSSQYLNTK